MERHSDRVGIRVGAVMTNSGGVGMTWIHPIIAGGCNRSTIRIAPTKYTDLPAPGNDGVWGTGRGVHIHGPDHLGQVWKVNAGQAGCTSTVQMRPGSSNVGRRRRTCPSILSPLLSPSSWSLSPRRAFHFPSCHPLHLQVVFLA